MKKGRDFANFCLHDVRCSAMKTEYVKQHRAAVGVYAKKKASYLNSILFRWTSLRTILEIQQIEYITVSEVTC